MSANRSCPSCNADGMSVFFEQNSVPTNSCILMASQREAINYPRGDISLGFCAECGFISNLSFDGRLTEYSGRYEETQAYSETFNAFQLALVDRLIERHGLHGKKILEIGCGKGEFITLLCERSGSRGVGFDPGYHEERNASPAASRVEFVQDFYSEKYAAYTADFIACKMTFEHIHRTGVFLNTLRRAIGDRSDIVVFFQVPDATRIVRDCAFEDIYYEHCSYFTAGSLTRLFNRAGFEVLAAGTEYDEQYLTIEARPVADSVRPAYSADLPELASWIAEFPQKWEQKRSWWRTRLDADQERGRRVVLWGSGSKAVAFLHAMDLHGSIQRVVDINPYRNGCYMPGTGQPIVAPAFLREYRPDVVIVMNSIYAKEIGRELGRMDLQPEVMTV